jgi:hypothetical protein
LFKKKVTLIVVSSKCNKIMISSIHLQGVGIAVGWMGFNSQQGKDFSLLYGIQTDTGAHPASYPMGTGGKMAGA